MYQIDQTNLFERLGLPKLKQLSRAFYERVYADPDPWFRDMFLGDMEDAIRNQYEFFAQRFGGPQLYSERKGHPALRGRHHRFAIPARAAGRWLKHMRAAMQAVEISEADQTVMWEYFYDTAHFLKNIDEDGKRVY